MRVPALRAPKRVWLTRARMAASVVSVVAALLLAAPPSLGGRLTYTVVSGHSMDPTYHTYDLAVTHRGGSAKPGDVIVYRVPEGEPGAGGQVIHRVIGGNDVDGYITKGDNREGPDIWHPRARDVVGTVVAIVPQGGRVLITFLNVRNLGLVGFGFMVWAVWPRKSERDQPAPKLAGVTDRASAAA